MKLRWAFLLFEAEVWMNGIAVRRAFTRRAYEGGEGAWELEKQREGNLVGRSIQAGSLYCTIGHSEQNRALRP